MNINDVYNLLSSIDIKENSFFQIDNSKVKSRIKNLVGKYIIFELHNKVDYSIELLPGRLLEYEDDSLTIRQYDDGTYETKTLWTDGAGNDLFENFVEKIHLDNIRGIEEYRKINKCLYFREEYKNCICEITNQHDNSIQVLIKAFDGYEIEMELKYNKDGNEFISEYFFPLYLLKDIKIVTKL